MDLDDIPAYQPDHPYTGTFSGQRIRRGLYRFANGRTANADINGAANILLKISNNFDFEGLCKGAFGQPFENKAILISGGNLNSNLLKTSRFYKRERFRKSVIQTADM